MIVAGIDCPPFGDPGHLTGDEDDVPVEQYYRVFMLQPSRVSPGGGPNDPIFELFVEVIEPIGGEAGASTTDAGIFREVIQLYK